MQDTGLDRVWLTEPSLEQQLVFRADRQNAGFPTHEALELTPLPSFTSVQKVNLGKELGFSYLRAVLQSHFTSVLKKAARNKKKK